MNYTSKPKQYFGANTLTFEKILRGCFKPKRMETKSDLESGNTTDAPVDEPKQEADVDEENAEDEEGEEEEEDAELESDSDSDIVGADILAAKERGFALLNEKKFKEACDLFDAILAKRWPFFLFH
jgi:hypothetical protein